MHGSDLPVFYRQSNDPESLRMAAFTAEDPADRDAFEAHWARVGTASDIVVRARHGANLARTRIRSAVRERRRVALFRSQREERTENPDVAGVVDVREALCGLPFRKRACALL